MHMPDTIPIARKVRTFLIPPAPVPKNSMGTRTKKVHPRMKDIRNPTARPDRTAAEAAPRLGFWLFLRHSWAELRPADGAEAELPRDLRPARLAVHGTPMRLML